MDQGLIRSNLFIFSSERHVIVSIWKNILKASAFLILLCAVIISLNGVLILKNQTGPRQMEAFYKLPNNSLDVLTIGSSHVFMNINTGALWDEYGIAAFNLGASRQPFWNSYYCLAEALKTQKPKLVILDVYYAMANYEYSREAESVLNIAGMKLSQNRFEASKATAANYPDYFLGLPLYHDRYASLGESDFPTIRNKELLANWKGYVPAFGNNGLEANPSSSLVDELKPLSAKTDLYLRKTIELAQEEGIPILLVSIPYPWTENEQFKYNAVEAIAAEYEIPFLTSETMLQNAELNFVGSDSDLADSTHLNYQGGHKIASYLGEYIKQNYAIPDRRGETGYESWQKDAEAILLKSKQDIVTKTEDIRSWLSVVDSESRYTLVVCIPNLEILNGPASDLQNALQEDGFEVLRNDNFDCAIIARPEDMIEISSSDNCIWRKTQLFQHMMIEKTDQGMTICKSYSRYAIPENTVTALVYNESENTIVEIASWNGDLDGKKNVIEAA